MAALFGIHLGNSSACIALCKDDERVEVVANDTGDRLTPTTVQWTPTQLLVGRGAVLEHFRYLSSTVVRNKQVLNDSISVEELEELKGKVPYKIHSKDSVKYDLFFDGKQHNVSAKKIALAIFEKLYAIAATSVPKGVELKAVLTVPMYFSAAAINSLLEIATKSGFTVLQVIDEPSAALLAVLPPTVDSGLCLVCRVGGVSLDTTLIDVVDGMYTVLATHHKSNCGGSYLTEKLRDFLMGEFSKQYKGQEITERGKHKLQVAADTAKQILSIQSATQCSAESVGGGFDLSYSVSRPRLENMVSTLLGEISSAVDHVLGAANVGAEDVTKVVICGGTMKIPRIQDQIRSKLPNAELLGQNCPDEIIAIGAAQQAKCCSMEDLEMPSTLSVDMPTIADPVQIKATNAEGAELFSKSLAKGLFLPAKLSTVLPDGCANVDVSVNGSGEVPCSFTVTSKSSLDLQVDKDGVMRLQLLDVKC